jgi:hypothetical protein
MSGWALTVAGFAAVGAALVLLNVYGRRPGTRVPSFGVLCGFLMRDRWGRIGVLLAWWWLGWHFLARS